MLVGVAGPKGSGKDTLAARLKLHMPTAVVRPFAEPLKRTCQQMYLLSEEQLYDEAAKERLDERWNLTPRQMFQQVGTDYVRRQLDPNFWLKHFELWYSKHCELSNSKHCELWYNQTGVVQDVVLVPDVRFQNEVDLIHRLGGKVVYVYRPFVHGADSHESEVSAVDLQHIDYTVNNCSTLANFYQEIDAFMKKF